jgi:sulfite reductase beta subunit-like hemoprotein
MGCIVTEKVWVPDHDGNQIEERRKVEAFLVHLGGHLGKERSFGRKVKGVKVLASETGPYVETLIRRYRSQRAEEEGFAAFVNRLSPQEFLAFSRKPQFVNLPPAPTIVAEPRAS